MLDRIKNIINKNKKDKKVYNEYIKCFCENEKINELLKDNEEFKKLKNNVINKKEEYFD